MAMVSEYNNTLAQGDKQKWANQPKHTSQNSITETTS